MATDKFAHEELNVWHKAVDFATGIVTLLEDVGTDRKHYRLFEQVEASAVSVAANIAEGKGRYSTKEFIHFLYIARGSLYETMTFLEIFRRKQWVGDPSHAKLDTQGKEIAAMLKGLINSLAE
ncbi:MAG: four helix bundle protein [Deltaproteobacteria bacterium CG_4_10_14_3_um_filter_60_8]|nr:MAG: four helix bundle protein [Deltaproteobacteria bacterium CG_4_10_14_3_um_filter_60_8]